MRSNICWVRNVEGGDEDCGFRGVQDGEDGGDGVIGGVDGHLQIGEPFVLRLDTWVVSIRLALA